MTDNIFEGDHTPSQDQNHLDQLVGDGKKFKTVEDLARSKIEADAFIEQIKSENAGLRNDLAARVKLEEVLDRLTSRSSEENDDSGNHSPDNSSRQPAISESELDRLIEAKITRKERERTVGQNRNQAKDQLQKLFGNDYAKHLNERAEALGLDKDYLNDLAGKSPTAFMALIAPNQVNPDRPFTPPRSAVNTAVSPTGQARPGDWDYYQKMKKENPTLYWSRQIQSELHNAMIKKGEVS